MAAGPDAATMTSDRFEELLQGIVEALASANIPSMVVGSFASAFHGEPRSTLDLDIVIDPSKEGLQELLRRLPPDRFYVDPDVAHEALRRRTMFNVIDMNTGWKVDLIIRKARPFSVEELSRRTSATIRGVAVQAATAEDTIIAKLEWSKAGGSDRQLQDVAGILRVRREALDLAYIERWVDELELREQWDRARSL